MVIEMVIFTVLWINAFSSHGGISTITSPRGIITRTNQDLKRNYIMEFYTYFQTHEENVPTKKVITDKRGKIFGSY